MPGSGRSSRVVKIEGYKFHIEEGIEIPLKPSGAGSKEVIIIMDKTRGRANKFSSHNYGGTFEIYCNARPKSGNYERNGIYFISEA